MVNFQKDCPTEMSWQPPLVPPSSDSESIVHPRALRYRTAFSSDTTCKQLLHCLGTALLHYSVENASRSRQNNGVFKCGTLKCVPNATKI
jgi:hypothetical protein